MATSCISSQQLRLPPGQFLLDGQIAVNPLRPMVLRSPDGGPSGLQFHFAQSFVIQESPNSSANLRWRTHIRMYEYRLLDHHQTELLVYHWQPDPDYLGPNKPHIHISASLLARTSAVSQKGIGLDTLHVVTGYVSLADVVQMLITEFGIAPQRHDWRDILNRTKAAIGEGDPAD